MLVNGKGGSQIHILTVFSSLILDGCKLQFCWREIKSVCFQLLPGISSVYVKKRKRNKKHFVTWLLSSAFATMKEFKVIYETFICIFVFVMRTCLKNFFTWNKFKNIFLINLFLFWQFNFQNYNNPTYTHTHTYLFIYFCSLPL